MSFQFRRAVRLAAGLIAVAIPLVGASVAQAGVAGSNEFVSQFRPDLVSATITGASSAKFCFDKPITSIADVGGFTLGGYKANTTTSSTAATASGNCVDATVSVSPWFTFAQVGEGAVRTTGNVGNRADSVALAGSNTNNGTRGRTTASDLTGISVVSGAIQQIAFTFDEPVNPAAIVGAGGFHFVTSSGIPGCPAINPGCDIASDTATVSATDPNTVIAQFPTGGGTPVVTNAVRGYVIPGAVFSDTQGIPDGWDSAPNAGSSGVVTGIPTLLSANYSRQPSTANVFLNAPSGTNGPQGATSCGGPQLGDCVVVDYTFNEAVSVNNSASSLAAFYAYLSNGSYVNPAAVTEPSGTNNGGGVYSGSTTVRAFYSVPLADARGFDEYLVKAGLSGATFTGTGGANAPGLSGTGFAPFTAGCQLGQTVAPSFCAVISTTTGHPNTPASQPIGGNTGGHAAGFTTAPDAFSTQFDTLTNTVSVLFDQRTYAPSPTTKPPAGGPWPLATTSAAEAKNFQLLDANGNEIAGGISISSCSPSTAGYPCALPTEPDNANGPGTTTVWVNYPSPAVQVGNAKGLEIRGYIAEVSAYGFAAIGGDVFNLNPTNGVINPIDPFDAGNVQQILSPTAVAAQTHKLRASKHWSHKRMTKVYLKHVLAKTKHHNSKH
jgi:hypothetical protein